MPLVGMQVMISLSRMDRKEWQASLNEVQDYIGSTAAAGKVQTCYHPLQMSNVVM